MQISVSKFLPYIRNILQDEEGESYSDIMLLQYFQDAIFRISIIRPDIFSSYVEIKTEPNNVLQKVSDEINEIIDVHSSNSNLALREARKTEMDSSTPDWISHKSGTPIQWMRDKRSTNRFYLYPAPLEETELTIQCVILPLLEDINTKFEFNMQYQPALIDGVAFLAQSIDDEVGSNQKASTFLGVMKQVLEQDTSTGNKIAEQQE